MKVTILLFSLLFVSSGYFINESFAEISENQAFLLEGSGFAFAAITSITPELESVPPLSILFLSPFGLMELVAYSLGLSRSFILIHAITKKINLIQFIKPTIIEIGIVVGLLLAGGYLEFYMIETAEKLIEMPGH